MKQKQKKKARSLMKKFDVIIIGGGPAGLSLGASLCKYYKDKSVLLIRRKEKNLGPLRDSLHFS